MPVFQYHHIVPWEVEEHFRPEDMMTLCPNCHYMATRGAMTEAEQRAHKANPLNIQQGYTFGQLRVGGVTDPGIIIGSNVFVGAIGVFIDDQRILAVGTAGINRVGLFATLFDKEDRLLARIHDNVWLCEDSGPRDLRFDHRVLKIQSAPRKINLEVDVSGSAARIRGDLWFRGTQIKASVESLTINGVNREQYRDSRFEGTYAFRLYSDGYSELCAFPTLGADGRWHWHWPRG